MAIKNVLYNRWLEWCFEKHNNSVILTKKTELTLKRSLQLNNIQKNNFILDTFASCLSLREKSKDYTTEFIHIHCVEWQQMQGDSTLCFLMKHFPSKMPRIRFWLKKVGMNGGQTPLTTCKPIAKSLYETVNTVFIYLLFLQTDTESALA